MMKLLWLTAALALSGASVANADDNHEGTQHAAHEGSAAQSTTEGVGSDTDTQLAKKECRSERVTGSRTKVNRICLTKAEWSRRSKQEAEELEKLRALDGRGGTYGN